MRRFFWILKRSVTRRSTSVRLFLLIVVCALLMWGWLVADIAANALLPTVADQDLEHFQRTRNLRSYIENTQLLIEPSEVRCGDILVLVSSSPNHFEAREAIRSTWGSHLTTFFVLGIEGYTEDDLMVDNYLEAKLHGDIITYQFRDHYQNLTLKTGLMLEWTINRCSTSKFLFKTDDDVLVNPWKLKRIVEERPDDGLIGYLKTNNYLHRSTHNKWHIPSWLLRDDFVPGYLSGTGYLVNVKYIRLMLQAAYTVPIINLEDVYFTYLVANKTLGIKLAHERGLSPYKPWIPSGCLYWGSASSHSLTPEQIVRWGSRVIKLGAEYERDQSICSAFANYGEWLLY
ncbi:unnamed protein product [Leptosia nina]|uniref:Hexosyltransferase n=1 Tax=Leptosia nina TaxID=320188 RepID=A0AAV1J2R6_9NEOP